MDVLFFQVSVRQVHLVSGVNRSIVASRGKVQFSVHELEHGDYLILI